MANLTHEGAQPEQSPAPAPGGSDVGVVTEAKPHDETITSDQSTQLPSAPVAQNTAPAQMPTGSEKPVDATDATPAATPSADVGEKTTKEASQAQVMPAEPAIDGGSQVAANSETQPNSNPGQEKPLGAFKIWTADDNGNFVNSKPQEPNGKDKDIKPTPDPAADEATDIYMSPTGRATDDQSKLYDDVNAVLDVVRRLYLPDGIRPSKTKFRAYYVRIFRLAQVGLTGTDPSPKQAKGALDSLKASLLDDEGLTIKTKNLSALGWTALKYSWPLALAYVFLLVVGHGKVEDFLKTLQISRIAAANITLLWMGCFVGVCLSYGVRTSTLTLADLVTPGPDRLPPSLRLLFIGTLTMFFGLLFMMKIVELKLGEYSTASIGTDPSLTFIVGILFGLSEAVLPGLAGKRAESFIKGLQ